MYFFCFFLGNFLSYIFSKSVETKGVFKLRGGRGGLKATFGQFPKVSRFFLGMSSLSHYFIWASPSSPGFTAPPRPNC